MVRSSWLILVGWMLLALSGCGGEAEVHDPGGTRSNGAVATDGGHTDAGLVVSDAAQPDAGEPGADATEADSGPTACGCPIGDGPYCGARALALADEMGCVLDPSVTDTNTLYGCEAGTWNALEQCSGECAYDPASPILEDECVLPVCDCFVEVAWCGSGAAKKAATMGCRIPLLPEHRGDILNCPGDVWSVKEKCELGCIEAAEGTPDICKTDADYLLPFGCAKTVRCSSGNNTSNHNGKDAWAFDFAVPVGTKVHAMRGGRVLRVRIVSTPGDSCYNGGGSACANYANTVEVKHSDGTIGLYMHISRSAVSAGDTVKQGDLIAYSGNSGWSTGPHLHVQVQTECGSWWCQSVPFKFGEKRSIAAGTTVASGNCPEP